MTHSACRRPGLELLAPARDAAVGMAAVDHGADAVYIGGPGFGARAAAGNSLEDIERLARYAHRFGARIYLTLNTLVFDHEYDEAVLLAHRAYEAGVDALIVQDLGLLEADLPPIEIHASTQCDVRTPEKAALLDALGFSQVVLARELTLEEIAACRQAMPRSRIEFFVHGALCVSYSGRCYLSCAQCARSANRGECAQPCRLPYTVLDEAGHTLARRKHVLSLMDNDQSGNLAELVRAGVTSFKIEGRLKGADYVKNITAWYRRKLDALLEGELSDYAPASRGTTRFFFTPDPQKTFHRGATDYFVHGRQDAIAQLDTPKSTGEVIGRVLELQKRDPQSILLQTRSEIANGDGLVYLDSHEELVGLNVNRAEPAGSGRTRIFLREPLARHPDLAVGLQLNRNKSRLFAKTLEGDTAARTLPVELTLALKGASLTLTARDTSSDVTVTIDLPFAGEAARTPDKAREQIVAALKKTGGTVFAAESVLIDAPFVPFVPVSVLNGLRRRALTALEEALVAHHQRHRPLTREPACIAPAHLDYTANCANRHTRALLMSLGAIAVDDAFECARAVSDAAELMRCRHCIRHTLGLCPKKNAQDAAAKERFKALNGGTMKATPLTLVNDKGEHLIAHFDCRACEMTITRAARASQSTKISCAKPQLTPSFC